MTIEGETEVPETPETPETPEVPDTPETPETPEAPEEPAAPESYWPDDWKEHMADGDEKGMKRLSRFGSPKTVFKSLLNAEAKISSGEFKQPEPAPEDEEKLVAWREKNGIPTAPEGYLEKLPDGLVLGEEDTEQAQSFVTHMHGLNAPPEYVQAAVSWYIQGKEKAAEEQLGKDEELKVETEETLRTEWGPEYRPNINRIGSFLDTISSNAKDLVLNARDASTGKPIASDPAFLQGLLEQALQINPAMTVVPSGQDAVQTISDELAGLKKLMGNRESEYWKGPKAEKMQARYLELLTAQEKIAERAA